MKVYHCWWVVSELVRQCFSCRDALGWDGKVVAEHGLTTYWHNGLVEMEVSNVSMMLDSRKDIMQMQWLWQLSCSYTVPFFTRTVPLLFLSSSTVAFFTWLFFWLFLFGSFLYLTVPLLFFKNPYIGSFSIELPLKMHPFWGSCVHGLIDAWIDRWILHGWKEGQINRDTRDRWTRRWMYQMHT